MRFKLKYEKPITDIDLYRSYLRKIKRFSLLCFLLLFLLNLILFHEDEIEIANSQLIIDDKRYKELKINTLQNEANQERMDLIEFDEY